MSPTILRVFTAHDFQIYVMQEYNGPLCWYLMYTMPHLEKKT
jgi:hypothetical protein